MTHIYESLGLNELNVSIKWVVPFNEQWDQNYPCHHRVDGWEKMQISMALVQNCSICIANALEILQSRTKPSMKFHFYSKQHKYNQNVYITKTLMCINPDYQLIHIYPRISQIVVDIISPGNVSFEGLYFRAYSRCDRQLKTSKLIFENVMPYRTRCISLFFFSLFLHSTKLMAIIDSVIDFYQRTSTEVI